ncbi:hypothetical protein RHGRI_019880 [Rhododendron griersonianum]|uniref:DUF4283 domain-containing protein n=1 Tax=Rhododendron griersonianum TaxID=479676 RepID=A0AAV6JLR2_9ERIC|nr:hypothetical protein RHGRI_019880 [Rhododendron griersonianum]
MNAENARLRRLLDNKTVSGPGNVLSWSNVVANGSTMVAGSGDGPTVTPASWVAPEKMKLEYIPPVVLNDRVVVSPPADVEALGQSKWEKCIVGHFLDKRLGFSGVRTIAMNIWEKFGICDVLSNEKGFFFFLFEGEKFHQLLERGPWHFGVDCSSPLPTSFDLKHANGDVVEIKIHYPWKPMMCSDFLKHGRW